MPCSFYLSATHKSSGKTMVSLGLCSAFNQLGYQVQSFKKGLDYIDPIWLALASQNPCYNLDFYTMSDEELIHCYQKNSANAQVSLVEGNKGLYDGLTTKGGDSNADLAQLLGLEVVLVIDATGITRGIAPLLQGYQNFDQTRIKGVILNKVATTRHESKLIAAVNQYTDLTVFGAIFRDDNLFIQERYLGLKPASEDNKAIDQVKNISTRVADEVDLKALLAIEAPTIKQSNSPVVKTLDTSVGKNIKLAIAKDKAFGFYYADDIDTFKKLGVDIIYFDTLNDKRLPQSDALLIGGGFPEIYAQALSNNQSLLLDIKEKITQGLPTYAQCGGLMYLTRSITTKSGCFEMVGIIEADTMMHQKPMGRGYVKLAVQDNHHWQTPGQTLCAHEFHYSQLINIDPSIEYVYRVARGEGIIDKKDGIIQYNLLASYAHLKNTQGNHWVEQFINFIKAKK